MKKSIKNKKAAILAIMLIASMVLVPLSGAIHTTNTLNNQIRILDEITENKEIQFPRNERDQQVRIDTSIPEIQSSLSDEVNDMGYNTDVSDRIIGARNIYPGEPEDTGPGRTRQGSILPSGGDTEDWYLFYACQGQSIQCDLQTSQDYRVELYDSSATLVQIPHTAQDTNYYFVGIKANEGANDGLYHLTVTLSNQNDASTGSDAGNTIDTATSIQPGTYEGYLDMNDIEDWYRFEVSSGQAISVTIEPLDESDYDIHLYDPSGEKVQSAQYYGEDTLTYPADTTGTWTIQIDIFPGYDKTYWPNDYFLYGSGPYELEISLGGSAEPPIEPEPQPQIQPLAQTFIINNDENSNKDEYGYLAAIPAANYLQDNQRYVSPILYQGVDKKTNWFGTIDDTTQYLLDDWNTYLSRHDLQAEEYILPTDPIEAAASIAEDKWDSSDTVILAVDGSTFEDTIQTLIDEQDTLNPTSETHTFSPDELRDIGGLYSKPMFISDKWGAIAAQSFAENFAGDIGIITPRYESLAADWWPHDAYENGPDTDVYFPITKPGIWMPYTDDISTIEEMVVTTIQGNRYDIPIETTDCSINITLTTDQPSNLRVYLIDPEGTVRRPSVPSWNGGPINQIHTWNGGPWEEIGVDEWRYWESELSTTHSVELHHPAVGTWTAIVVPPSLETASNTIDYTINAKLRIFNQNRINAGLSASNAAVIASIKHAPLLYVTENDVPSETQQAMQSLGATTKIFVNIGDVSSADPSATTTYTSMTDVLNAIKQETVSENYITITSFATGDGYFGPAAMIAAYHASPILNIGEAAVAYDTIDIITSFEEYAGDYYHGCRSLGHLASMDHPFDFKEMILGFFSGEFPHPGFDQKLRWYSQTYESMASLVNKYNLDKEGKEVFMFVSPRNTDIRSHIARALEGNKSYAGQIPVETPAFSTALICRNILYPALIYANPGRDFMSAIMMNHWESFDWITNDGTTHTNQFTRRVKEIFSSNERIFSAHIIWDNILNRYNDGASVIYHSSHGTGGSGICCMYKNFEEQFPYVDLRHDHLLDFDWWDAWRGYYYDNLVTGSPRENGRFWCNSVEPTLYDIVHFKWCDQLFDNLHSQINLWQSCTTAHHFGPMIYLEHGAVFWYGNSNTGRSPQTDFMDSWWFEDFFIHGKGIGESHAELLWLFGRDYTTNDPTTLYGVSSMDASAQVSGDGEGLVNTWVFFGDPELKVYQPDWSEPVPQEV